MASNPKPALSVWLAAKRKERGASVADIARLLDRSDVTIRGWEAGKPPSVNHPAIAVLEAYYGSEAPREAVPGFGDLVALVAEMREQNRIAEERTEVVAAAIREQTEMLRSVLATLAGPKLTPELQAWAHEQWDAYEESKRSLAPQPDRPEVPAR